MIKKKKKKGHFRWHKTTPLLSLYLYVLDLPEWKAESRCSIDEVTDIYIWDQFKVVYASNEGQNQTADLVRHIRVFALCYRTIRQLQHEKKSDFVCTHSDQDQYFSQGHFLEEWFTFSKTVWLTVEALNIKLQSWSFTYSSKKRSSQIKILSYFRKSICCTSSLESICSGNFNLCPAEWIQMPHPLLISSQSDYLIQIVAVNSHT